MGYLYFFYLFTIGVGSQAGARRGKGGVHRLDPALFPADDGTPSPPADHRHSGRCRTQNGRGRAWGATPGKHNGHPASGRRAGESPGNRRLSRRTPLDNWSTSRAGWACEMVGSGRVSSAVAHLSKSRRAARRRDAIADRMSGTVDHRPAVGRGLTIGRHFRLSAHLTSALTRL